MAMQLNDINLRTVSDPKGLIEEGDAQYRDRVTAAAEKIIRAAVCEAWNMPADALDNWAVVTRLVQDAITVEMTEDGPIQNSMVYYRVFLTRPDEEVGLDTFGGRDNFNYRVSTDGNILTTEDWSGWYSPKEDMERWKK